MIVGALVCLINLCSEIVSAHSQSRVQPPAVFCAEPSLPTDGSSPPFRARLSTSRETITAGQHLYFRIENLGTERVTYGLGFRLARLDKGKWIRVPTGPHLQPILSVPARSVGPCQRLGATKGSVAGKYRILKDVSAMEGKRQRTRTLRAFFRVR
jgi:hypothetical protein